MWMCGENVGKVRADPTFQHQVRHRQRRRLTPARHAKYMAPVSCRPIGGPLLEPRISAAAALTTWHTTR